MTRVLVLFVCLLLAGGIALFVKWDTWFGDEDPTRTVDRAESETDPPLPDVRVERVPAMSVAGTFSEVPRSSLTKEVVDALTVLTTEGEMKLSDLGGFARQKKLKIDLVLAMPGVEPFSVEDVEKLGETGAVDRELLKTVARDQLVPVEAVAALSKSGSIPSKFVRPLEILSTAGNLPIDELEVKGDELLLVTTRLTVGGTRPIHGVSVFDDQGKTIRLTWDSERRRWVVPEKFDAPVTHDRMKIVCRALDGLGAASPRGRAATRHKVYEVEGDTGKRVKLEDESGQTVLELRIGKMDQAPGSRSRGTFVRPVGSDVVYRHDQLMNTVTYASPNQYIDLRFVPIDYQEANAKLESVERIVLEYDDIAMGPAMPQANTPEPTGERVRFVLTCEEVKKEKPEAPVTGPETSPPPGDDKDTERKWTLAEPSDLELETSLPMVDSIVRMVLNGRKEDVVGVDLGNPEYGLDKPVVELTVSFRDGSAYVLKVGNQVPVEGEPAPHQARSRYAELTGSPYVMQVSEYTVKALMKRPSDLEDQSKKAAANLPGPSVPLRPEIIAPDERPKGEEEKEKPVEDPDKG